MPGDPQYASTTNLLHLLDQLEAHVRNGRRVALMNVVGVDEKQVLSLIDYLRMAIPHEMQQARRVVQQRQSIIQDAQEQAERIILEAHDRAEYIVSRHGVLAEARQRAEHQLRESHEESLRVTEGASRFALSVMDNLEGIMREQLKEIERARTVLADQPKSGGEVGEPQHYTRLDR